MLKSQDEAVKLYGELSLVKLIRKDSVVLAAMLGVRNEILEASGAEILVEFAEHSIIPRKP
jgi:hypothetical protein